MESLLTRNKGALDLNVEKPKSAINEYATELFINVIINFELNGEKLAYKPVGARFTTKMKHELPNLYKALTERDNALDILTHDLEVVKGSEIKREEFKQTIENLDPSLKAMLSAITPEDDRDYTDYLKIVGNIYATSKSGTTTKLNVFNPSMDVKVGHEAKELDRQKMLLAAVLLGNKVEVKLDSIKVNAPSDTPVEDEY